MSATVVCFVLGVFPLLLFSGFTVLSTDDDMFPFTQSVCACTFECVCVRPFVDMQSSSIA